MPLVTLDEARAHLRVEADYPEEQIQPYLDAAIDSAEQFLGRSVFATRDELVTAKAAVPAALVLAAGERDAAIAAAQQVEDLATREWMCAQARADYEVALANARRIGQGMVIKPSIKAAILLTLGHLDENREDVARGVSVTQLPIGAQHLLWPYRVNLGV
ncbi:head-tail connector protein [Paracidovorax citrulli]|uniref:head-tail connector protein n=1 Tax=Paracidovorax citrulli TaxID=80869 RepID=UPI0005FAC949|nr:head-tail connector protein [Paracidovorax citrulli]